jgi:hypothetical protein
VDAVTTVVLRVRLSGARLDVTDEDADAQRR